jgi:hypothetical protein
MSGLEVAIPANLYHGSGLMPDVEDPRRRIDLIRVLERQGAYPDEAIPERSDDAILSHLREPKAGPSGIVHPRLKDANEVRGTEARTDEIPEEDANPPAIWDQFDDSSLSEHQIPLQSVYPLETPSGLQYLR